MARLLFEWINDEVKLSRPVDSLEYDFADGFLIGELLHKFNQQPDFGEFLTNGTADAKVKNFCLLENSMRQIGVPYNSRIAQDIMMAKPNVMKTLLYEIKTALDGISKRFQGKFQRPEEVSDGAPKKLIRSIEPSRPVYDKSMSNTFQNVIKANMLECSTVLAGSLIKPTLASATINTVDYFAELETRNDELRRRKQIEKQRKLHEHEFEEAWNIKNVEQWRKNQMKASQRRAIGELVKTKLATKREAKSATMRDEARIQTLESIDDFEAKLHSSAFIAMNGLDTKAEEQLNKTMFKTTGELAVGGVEESLYLDQGVLRQALASTQKEMKEHHKIQVHHQQLHSKKRRKFSRDSESLRIAQLQNIMEEEIVAQVLQPCFAEIVQRNQHESVERSVHLIAENVRNRQNLLNSMLDSDAARLEEWTNCAAEQEVNWTVQQRLDSQCSRLAETNEAVTSANRRDVEVFIGSEVERILSVVNWVITFQEYNVQPADVSVKTQEDLTPLIPNKIWNSVKLMYISEFDLPAALSTPNVYNVSESLPYSLSVRPNCVDQDELLAETLQSSNILAQLKGEASESNTEGCVCTGNPEVSLSDNLARSEALAFIANLQNSEGLGGLESAISEKLPIPDPSGKTLNNAPSWLLTAPAKYVLGEILVDVSVASQPFPPLPSPAVKVDLSSFPIRLALAGPCKAAKKALAKALNAKYNVNMINAEVLVHEALEYLNMPKINATTGESDKSEGSESSVCDQENLDLEDDGVEPAAESAPLIEGDVEKALEEDNKAALEAEKVDEIPSNPEIAPQGSAVLSAMSGEEGECVTVPQLEIVYFDEEAYGECCKKVESILKEGLEIPDDIYVDLIVFALNKMSACKDCAGYVLEDFPNSRNQALLLFKALSGFDYSSFPAQRMDRWSIYANACPAERQKFDVSKCGLSTVLYIDGEEPCTVLRERVSERIDLNNDQVVYLDSSFKSVASLVEPYKPLHPVSASGVDVAMTQLLGDDLTSLLEEMNILEIHHLGDSSYYDLLVEHILTGFNAKFMNSEDVGELPVVDEAVGELSSPEPEAAEGEPIVAIAPAPSSSAVSIAPSVAETLTPPVDVLKVIALPKQLADALSAVWQAAEKASNDASSSFVSSYSDIRFQMVQRRRIIHDALWKILCKRDAKQSMLEEFRSSFNAADNDFRFDINFQSEWYLRSLELRTALWDLCLARRLEAEEYLNKVCYDGQVGLLLSRCSCEAAAFLQSEVNRYIVGINIMLDYAKVMSGFTSTDSIYGNELEVFVGGQEANQEKGGKDAKKDKKATGKDKNKDTTVARNPICELYFDSATAVTGLPVIEPAPALAPLEGSEMIVDPADAKKGKGKEIKEEKKGKKDEKDKGTLSDLDIFQSTEKSVVECCNAYAEGNFTLSRGSYNNDEVLCKAIERAIWYETKKLMAFVSQMKELIVDNTTLIKTLESDIQNFMREVIKKQQLLELSVCERLIDMIQSCIEECSPIETVWLVAPDAIAVLPNRTVYDWKS